MNLLKTRETTFSLKRLKLQVILSPASLAKAQRKEAVRISFKLLLEMSEALILSPRIQESILRMVLPFLTMRQRKISLTLSTN